MPSLMARAPHGSPTQQPSILPIFMLATICGGGPVSAFGDGGIDAGLFEESFLVCNDDGGTIRQRDHAEAQFGCLRRAAGERAADPAFREASQERGESDSCCRLPQEVSAVQLR